MDIYVFERLTLFAMKGYNDPTTICSRIANLFNDAFPSNEVRSSHNSTSKGSMRSMTYKTIQRTRGTGLIDEAKLFLYCTYLSKMHTYHLEEQLWNTTSAILR